MARRREIDAETLRLVQERASFDIAAKPVSSHLHNMVAQQRLLEHEGVTADAIGLRHDLEDHGSIKTVSGLCSTSHGHAAAPRSRSERSAGQSTHHRHRTLHRQIARHRQVERLLRDGRDPLRPGAGHVLCDPVVAAVIRHHGDPDAILDAMPVDQPFVSRRGFFQVQTLPPLHEEVGAPMHAELEPGRLDVVRIALGERAHYAPPDPETCRRVGILTIRRETWPMDVRIGIVGRRLSEIVGVPGIPDGHVVRTCTHSSGSMVMRVEGDHAEVPVA